MSKTATILDVSGIAVGRAVIMGSHTVVADLKISGDISPLTDIGRSILAGDDSEIDRVWMSTNDYGVDAAGKKRVHLSDVTFDNIHDKNGWAACVHGSTGTDDLQVDNIDATDCDRGVEFENGANNLRVSVGTLTNIVHNLPALYTFVADGHSHPGAGVVRHVLYEHLILNGCEGITANNDNKADRVADFTFRDITMNAPSLSVGQNAIWLINADGVVIDGIAIHGLPVGANVTHIENCSDVSGLDTVTTS